MNRTITSTLPYAVDADQPHSHGNDVEWSIDLDDLKRLAPAFERLIRGNIDAGSAAWTIAKVRSLLLS